MGKGISLDSNAALAPSQKVFSDAHPFFSSSNLSTCFRSRNLCYCDIYFTALVWVKSAIISNMQVPNNFYFDSLSVDIKVEIPHT